MDMDVLKNQKLGKDKLKAMELAEDSRETEWTFPSFVAGIFKGRLDWNMIIPFPVQSEDDRRLGDELLVRVEELLRRHIDPEKVDETGELPEEALRALGELGLFAMKIPREYGGLGLSQVNYNRVCHLVASYCASTAVWLSAHQSIGVPQPLILFGTEEQKKKYFPGLRKGKFRLSRSRNLMSAVILPA